MPNKSKIDFLSEIYREAQIKLISIISGKYGAGTKTYYNSVLKQVEALMKQLSAKTGKYIEMSVPKEYKKSLDETYRYFKKNHLKMKQPDMFARIHSDAVYELSREMQYHINLGISQAGRRVIRYLDSSRDNALRQAGLRASAVKIASGQTVLNMQEDLLKRLSEDGFMKVQYGSGKKAYQVGLDTYTSMVARSTTREAGNLARKNQLKEKGYDLMIMTEHYPTCEICAMYQGRVYSISGKDKRFPPLSKIFSDGYMNTHPNCRHSVVPFIEELQSEEELRTAIEKSNKPFKDTRSDSEKSLYTKQQTENRRMRSDRFQYERYKKRLGDDSPSSFSAFRRIKKGNGEKWKELQKKYKEKSNSNYSQKSLTSVKKYDKINKEEQIKWLKKGADLTPEQKHELITYAKDKKIILTGLNKTDVDIPLTKEMIDEAEKILKVYPELNNNPQLPFTIKMVNGMSANDFAMTTKSKDINIVQLNANAFRNKAKLAEEYQKLVDEGWFVEGTTYRSIIVHEMGHMYEHQNKTDVFSICKEILGTEKNIDVLEYLAKNLSEYSSIYTDGSEIISEIFSSFYTGKPKDFEREFIEKLKG